MRILMVIPYFVPAWSYGGPVSACYTISKNLVRNGHEVTVLTTDTLDNGKRIKILKETIDGINIIRLKNLSNFLAKRMNISTPIGFSKWLRTNASKFDIIHCHDFFTIQNIKCSRIAKSKAIPYVIQPHGSAVPKIERGKSGIKEVFNILFGKEIILNAKTVIVLTEKEKQEIRDYFHSENITILANGIEITRKLSINNSIAASEFGIPNNSKIILSMGRLHYIKGFDLLIKSFKLINDQDKNAYLLIAGPDEGELKSLTKLINKLDLGSNVILTGQLLGQKKDNAFNICDVFAFFSRNEPFPIVVLEALAAHKPIIVSKYVGLSKYIRDYKCGLIVDPQLDNEAAKKILYALEPRNNKQMSAATNKLLDIFDIQNIVKELVLIYKK